MAILLPPSATSINDTADWVEYDVISKGSQISQSDLSSIVEKSAGRDLGEEHISDIFLELERRQFRFGNISPFVIEQGIIKSFINWQDRPEYMTCLILAVEGVRGNTTHTGKLFERITNEAVKRYIQGESIIFGHPNQQTIRELAKLLNGEFIQELGNNIKDRRLDIIAWKPFRDKRNNQLTLLIQCKSGIHWRESTTELPLRAWCKCIHWGCPPTKGLAVTAVIGDNEFRDRSDEADFLFDRIRIFEYSDGTFTDTTLHDELVKWCKSKLEE